MKFFISYTSESESTSPFLSKMVSYLEQHHTVFIYRHIFSNSNEEFAYNKLIKELDDSDAFIGEMSFPSQTLGFQLAYSLHNSKPSLYLYSSKKKKKPEGLIGSIPSRKLSMKKINENNFKQVIDDFVAFTEKQLLTIRTSFMSTKEIDNYLSYESRKQKLSKGELIRQLLGKSISN